MFYHTSPHKLPQTAGLNKDIPASNAKCAKALIKGHCVTPVKLTMCCAYYRPGTGGDKCSPTGRADLHRKQAGGAV